jgi:hypothetical protein
MHGSNHLTNFIVNKDSDDDGNVFDHLPALVQPKTIPSLNELTAYLNADTENVTDVIAWWNGHRKTYPRLSRMALDYLTIPGMCIFIYLITLF